MRCTRYLLPGLVAVGNVLVAADQTQWMTEWSTTTCWSTKEAETVWSTQYSTTTCWSTSTPPPVTVYDTITSSKTVYDTVITSTTVEVPYTTTSVVEKDFTTTVYSSYAQVVTSVETSVATVTKIVVSTLTVPSLSIATATATSVNVVPGKGYTSTVIIQNTKTITQACVTTAPAPTPTPTLTGIVVCPTRTLNEQGYVPPTPLPSTYLWGCPPGKLCKPKQFHCNFEAGVYADTYICAPEDCINATQPLPIDEFGGPYADDYSSTCAFFEPDDDYPIINPTQFGLDYSEFAVTSLGIYPSSCPPAVPAPPPVTTTTTPPPPPVTTTTTTTSSVSYIPPPSSKTTTQWLPWTTSSPPPLPVSSSTTQWLPWTYSSSYVPPPSSSTWSSYVPPAPVVSSSTWGDWAQSSSAEEYSSGWDHPSATTTWSHGVTPRALVPRAPADSVPIECQKVCDNCVANGGFVGKVFSNLCTPGASFSVASVSCSKCIISYKTAQPSQMSVLIPQLNQLFDVCLSGAPKSTTVPAPPVQTSPSKTATTTPKPPPTTTATPTTTSPKPPPTTVTTKPSSTPTTSITPTTPTTTPTVVVTTPTTTPPTTTTTTTPPSSTTPSSPETSSECVVSQISDGQAQNTCTSANTSIATYSGTGNAAAPHATQRPAAVMGVVVVAVVIAMV